MGKRKDEAAETADAEATEGAAAEETAATEETAAPAAPVRLLMVGTTFPFADKTLRLLGDVAVESADGMPLSDGGFAGLLATSGPGNFQANIGQLAPARYNPSTGAYVPNECDTCGAAILGDDVAADCPDCVTAKAQAAKDAEEVKE